jgi:hypothetical protein
LAVWNPNITKAVRKASELLEIEHPVRLFDRSEARDFTKDPLFPESPAVSIPIYVEGAIPIACSQRMLRGIYRKQIMQKVLAHECCHIRMWELNFPIIAIDWGGNPQQSPFNVVRLDGQRLLSEYTPLDARGVVTISIVLTEFQTYTFGYGRLGASYWRSLENFDFRMTEQALMTGDLSQVNQRFQVMTSLALLYAAARRFGNMKIRRAVESSSKYPNSFLPFCHVLLALEPSSNGDEWVKDFRVLLQAGKALYCTV